MKGNGLKIVRIIVSLAVFFATTLLWVCYGPAVARYMAWATKIQIFPMAMALSVNMAAFWVLAAWLFGRIYCSSVCPLGTWFDIVGAVGRHSRKGTLRDYHYSPALNRWRYGSLLLVLACFIGEVTIVPALVDPYSIYGQAAVNLMKPCWGYACNLISRLGEMTGLWHFGQVRIITAGVFYTALSGAILLSVSIPAWLYGRTYCNSICPIGTVLGMCSRQSLWHIDIDTDVCTNCRKCEHVCKASCINMDDHVVDGSRCVNCFDCLAVCPDDAIFYRITRKQLSLPMMQRINPPGVNATASCASAETTSYNPTKQNDNETIS